MRRSLPRGFVSFSVNGPEAESTRAPRRHTSLVLYGMEVFFGQGISIVSPPGTTHVRPLRTVSSDSPADDVSRV